MYLFYCNEIMIIPSYLSKGDTIAITCPAGYLPQEKTILATSTLEQWGFNVVIGNTVGQGENYFAGTDSERGDELQGFLDDEHIHAILMGRGGYGISRIIDRLNFEKFVEHPKWICGFSDITVLHSHVQQLFGIATLHSPMCGAFKENTLEMPHILSLRDALVGEAVHYPQTSHAYNRPGEAVGVLVGGNLAILAHLCGSVSQLDTTGKILFIEDIGEHLYRVDRMLITLKRAGMLDKLSGLICGGFTDIEDTERPFGKGVEEIILDQVNAYNYPVCFGFPVGHNAVNYALKLGTVCHMQVSADCCTLNAAVFPA